LLKSYLIIIFEWGEIVIPKKVNFSIGVKIIKFFLERLLRVKKFKNREVDVTEGVCSMALELF